MLRLFSIDFRSATGINAVMLDTTYVQRMQSLYFEVPFGLLTLFSLPNQLAQLVRLPLTAQLCPRHNFPVFYHRAHSTSILCGYTG